MNFQSIPPVEKPKPMLDAAFGAARAKAAAIKKGKAKRWEFSRLQKEKELTRIRAVHKVLMKRLMDVVKSFPSLNNLTEFYQELTKCFLDIGAMKKSLGAVNWAAKRVELLSRGYEQKVKWCRENKQFPVLRNAYYGRISSTLKQVEDDLAFLDECRKVLRKFPRVKDEFTVAIAGFPNVGKSTLLAKLTGTNPKIAAYAFTTKRLNVGYIKTDYGKIQLVDTPGTLNRFDKMNYIERQAHLAMSHLAHCIVYVFDLTEPYPRREQEKLLKRVKELKKPLLVYVSKEDLIGDKVKKFCKKKEAYCLPDDIKKQLEGFEKEYRQTKAKEAASAPANKP